MSDPLITIQLTHSEADGLQTDVSDFLCWIQGFNAGASISDSTGYPFDIEMMRRLNIKLKTVLYGEKK